MKSRLRLTSYVLFLSISFINSTAFADSLFSICGEGMTECSEDSQATWDDKLSKINYSTESEELIDYDGIAIDSQNGGPEDRPSWECASTMTIYLKGYKGIGKYTLEGTEDTVWSSKSNAVYGNSACAPYWISPQNTNGSYVEVTKDQDGLISGNYKITTYLDGQSSNTPLNREGEFTDIPKKTH